MLISRPRRAGAAWQGKSGVCTLFSLWFLMAWVGSPAWAGQRVPVLTVTHDTVARTSRPQVCWDVIVSDRERARRQYEQQSWVVKYWKPVLGGILGGALGYHFTANYGPTHRKWVYPTVAGGMAVGALAGPGAVMGGYGLGKLAYEYFPTKLPVVAGVSLVGAILGNVVFNFLFPDAVSSDLLAPTTPGVYLPEQQFYIETSCLPRTQVQYTESAYRVVYMYQGERRTAMLPHFPGNTIELDAEGRPVQAPPSPASLVRMREVSQ